jgi:16S rRNA G966 N2-methylase RsmD
MSHLVRFLTNEGATILDCYAGSGTIGVSAALNNRNFIGIDLDPNYLEISKHRIWNALERLKNPKNDDYRYFCHFIDPEIIKKQKLKLRRKILSGEADFSERLVYQHLFSALAWISEKKAA